MPASGFRPRPRCRLSQRKCRLQRTAATAHRDTARQLNRHCQTICLFGRERRLKNMERQRHCLASCFEDMPVLIVNQHQESCFESVSRAVASTSRGGRPAAIWPHHTQLLPRNSPDTAPLGGSQDIAGEANRSSI